MSVFTPLNKTEVTTVLENYQVGSLLSFKGVEEGVENSNFFISTLAKAAGKDTIDEYVLTLFENQKENELDFFIKLLNHLSEQHLPVPHPLKTQQGACLITVKGKPALLAPRLKGMHPVSPTQEQCQVMGATLAKIHLATANFPLNRDNDRDIRWMNVAAHRSQSFLNTEDNGLLQNELKLFRSFKKLGFNLPKAVIHGDLFRDNTLFMGNTLSGILDFYNACHFYCCYDLAVTVNDWCKTANGEINETAMQTLVDSYGQIRHFTQEEKEVWPVMLRYAACRFWLSRLLAKHFPTSTNKKQALIKVKDPDVYKNVLLHLVDNTYHL